MMTKNQFKAMQDYIDEALEDKDLDALEQAMLEHLYNMFEYAKCVS